MSSFNSEADASRFLNRYFEGELDGPIGFYVVSEATL